MTDKLTKNDVKRFLFEYADGNPGNLVPEFNAIAPDLAGLPMFGAPIIGFASADDPIFDSYKKVGVIGPWHMTPKEWMPEAKTVISFFFPMSEEVKRQQGEAEDEPAPMWLQARIEGQEYIKQTVIAFGKWFESCGVTVEIPLTDGRFATVKAGKGFNEYREVNGQTFGSNWSERHAAYACGLGTFGMSRGLITRKGVSGRFGSLIIDLELPADRRIYTGVYDYCIRCGACARRCPAKAIPAGDVKDHSLCYPRLQENKKKYAPRHGCGLCQSRVPCESKIPDKHFRELAEQTAKEEEQLT